MTASYLDNPLNPHVISEDSGTTNLSEVLELVMMRTQLDLRVCIPAVIVAIDGNQQVDVQPLLKARYIGQATPTSMRVITQLPVSMPMGQDWGIRLPIAVGDTGYLLCADRSLDDWLAGDGSEVEPTELRTHSLQDAIFVPGLVPYSKQTQDTTTDLTLRNGHAMVRLEKNGTFRVANQGQELIALVIQLTQALATLTSTMAQAQVLTINGPAGFWQVSQQQLAQQLATAQQLLANLQTLEGA